MYDVVTESPQIQFDRYVDAAHMEAAFRERFLADLGSRGELASCEIVDAKCKTYLSPATRHKSNLSVCYRLAITDSEDGALDSQLVYARAYLDDQCKTFEDDLGREVQHRTDYLWDVARAEGFGLAEPLGYLDALRTVWQVGIDGTPLQHEIRAENHEHVLDAVARGLVVLHHSNLPTRSIITLAQHLEESRKKVTKLCREFNNRHGVFHRLLDTLHACPAISKAYRHYVQHRMELGHQLSRIASQAEAFAHWWRQTQMMPGRAQ